MFCQSCGSQVAGAFCTKCGARASQPAPPPPPPVQPGGPPPSYNPAPPPPPPPQYAPPQQQYAPPQQQYAPQPLPPPAKSGSGLKILFVVLGVFALLGFMFVGAIWYGWHKVKEKAADNGIDLNELSQTQHGPRRRLNACSLLSKSELSQLVGMNIDRVEGDKSASTHTKCTYFSESAIDKSTDAATDALKRIQDGQVSGGNTPAEQEKAMKEVGNIMRGISGTAANGMVVSVEVETDNAKATMGAFKIAMGILTVGDKEHHKVLREDIKGVGDEAIMGLMASIFMFRKGDVAVSIDGRGLTGGRETQIEIGKRIAARL